MCCFILIPGLWKRFRDYGGVVTCCNERGCAVCAFQWPARAVVRFGGSGGEKPRSFFVAILNRWGLDSPQPQSRALLPSHPQGQWLGPVSPEAAPGPAEEGRWALVHSGFPAGFRLLRAREAGSRLRAGAASRGRSQAPHARLRFICLGAGMFTTQLVISLIIQ